MILSGSRIEQERIITINYQLYPINKSAFSTYPLKSSSSAWEELVKGEGYIANIGEGNDNEAFIRDAYIAYFDPGEYQEYLPKPL